MIKKLILLGFAIFTLAAASGCHSWDNGGYYGHSYDSKKMYGTQSYRAYDGGYYVTPDGYYRHKERSWYWTSRGHHSRY